MAWSDEEPRIVIFQDRRGAYECENFEVVKDNFDRDPQSARRTFDLSICLLVQGQDYLALEMLRDLALTGKYVPAAFVVADYFATGGTMNTSSMVPDRLDSAFTWYDGVLTLIKSYPDYPSPLFVDIESSQQYELNAYYNLMTITFLMYTHGLEGVAWGGPTVQESYDP